MKKNVGLGKEIGEFQMDLTQRIGIGSFGKVYLGKHKVTQEIVAIKMIYVRDDEQKKQLEIFQKEVTIMKQLNHPNLVKYIASYMTTNNLYVVMEYCEGGTLNEYIQKKLSNQGLKYLAESEAIIIMKQLILGYKEMYNNKIVHRDLKPANILMKHNVVKITDFGFGKCLQNYQNDLLQTYTGSPLYMSPQILYQSQQYTTKTDIWSLGIIFFEVLFGRPPWDVKTLEQLYLCVKQKRLEFPKFPVVSQKMKDIIFKMIQYEEQDRMSWEELFQLQVFMEQSSQEKILKTVILITNESDNFKKINLEKNLYVNGLGQNLQQVRERQLAIERQYLNIVKYSSYSALPGSSLDKMRKILSQQSFSPKSPNKTRLNQKLENQEMEIRHKCLIQEIQDWINHKRNKSLFLNGLTSQMFEVFSDDQYDSDKGIYKIACLIITKYQIQILDRLFQKFQKKLIDGQTKRYTQEQWEIFCNSSFFNTSFDAIKNEYILIQKFLQDLINLVEQSISQLNQPIFDQVKQICNIYCVRKQEFDPIFDQIVMFYFTSQLSQVQIEKLNINYLKFLLSLKHSTKIHSMFKFKQIDFFKYYDELEFKKQSQLIYEILE